MKLSIVIPVFNEHKTIKEVINRCNSLDLKNIEKEIIIVDDYSNDGTRKILKRFSKNHIIMFHDYNKGKGAALRTGFEKASGDIIVVHDADLEYDTNDIKRLIDVMIKKNLSVVYGSRFLRNHTPRYFLYFLGNIIISLFASLLFLVRVTDVETCYKMFRSKLLQNIDLKQNRFGFEPEITAKFLKNGYKIVEVPIYYKCRDFKEGKKITWKDGVKALWILLKYRFVD